MYKTEQDYIKEGSISSLSITENDQYLGLSSREDIYVLSTYLIIHLQTALC